MKAWPQMTVRADRSVFSPRVGLIRAFSRPWSHSILLLAYWSVLWNASGASSSMARASGWARSVTTSAG